MQVIKEIKLGRLAFAVLITVLIADTAPHPSLSAGLLESSWQRLEDSLTAREQTQTAIARPAR
jgi:hypothetical protein